MYLRGGDGILRVGWVLTVVVLYEVSTGYDEVEDECCPVLEIAWFELDTCGE